MQTLFADLTISMSDFKKNPTKVLRDAGSKPVAVLNHNKPAFYMVNPELFAALMERMDDLALAPLLKERLAQRGQAVEVKLEDL